MIFLIVRIVAIFYNDLFPLAFCIYPFDVVEDRIVSCKITIYYLLFLSRYSLSIKLSILPLIIETSGLKFESCDIVSAIKRWWSNSLRCLLSYVSSVIKKGWKFWNLLHNLSHKYPIRYQIDLHSLYYHMWNLHLFQFFSLD